MKVCHLLSYRGKRPIEYRAQGDPYNNTPPPSEWWDLGASATSIRITQGWVIDRYVTPTIPGRSVGNTFTFDAVEDTDSIPTSNISIIETLARASLENTHLPGSPGTETKRVGQLTALYGTDAPKIPPFRGMESVIRITLGWVIDRSFTPIAQ